MNSTEPVTARRTVWTGLHEMSRQTDMAMLDRILGAGIEAADYETRPFLALRMKLIRAIQSCYEDESLQKLGGDGGKEASTEVELTIGEATYLDVLVQVSAFEGALTLKKDLWRVIDTLYARHRKEKEAL